MDTVKQNVQLSFTVTKYVKGTKQITWTSDFETVLRINNSLEDVVEKAAQQEVVRIAGLLRKCRSAAEARGLAEQGFDFATPVQRVVMSDDKLIAECRRRFGDEAAKALLERLGEAT